MSDDDLRIEPPEDIESVGDLTGWLSELADSHNRLVAEVERINGNVNSLAARLSRENDHTAELENRLADLERQLDDVNGQVEVVEATMPDQTKARLDRIEAILEYAYTHGSGGRAGVTVETGEATAASGASRDTALRLMDEIAGSFEWAETHNPGGPRPKQLRLAIRGREQSDLVSEVREQYA